MRRALVLSGGGAWGSWQVGACEHLILERDYWFDVIAGVSVGAINGAALAHGHDRSGLKAHCRRLRDWWLGVRGNENIYRWRKRSMPEIGRAGGLLDVTPLREEVLGREIDPEQVAGSPIQLRVGYVDLRTRRYRTVGNDHPRLRDVLLASASVPILFPVTRVPGTEEVGVDGGLHHAAPLEDAVSVLAELPSEAERAEIWVILLSPRPAGSPVGVVQRLLRMAAPSLEIEVEHEARVAKATVDVMRVSGAIHGKPLSTRMFVLRPRRMLPGAWLDFDPARIRSAYADGLSTARHTQELALAS